MPTYDNATAHLGLRLANLRAPAGLRLGAETDEGVLDVTATAAALGLPAPGDVDDLTAGFAIAPDYSVYAPGYRPGEQVVLSCNAYLMCRAGAWILWDTGIGDALATEAGGRIVAQDIRGLVVRTLRDQLTDIGLAPAAIGIVILSHAHSTTSATRRCSLAAWYVQRREHAAMFGPDPERYGYVPSLYDALGAATMTLMDGDHDLFGDGSVRVLATPGHTPGHCSLLVRLPKTGPILLSADVAHFRFTMEQCCVPAFNSDPEASLIAMERVAAIVRAERAQLWLNHDIVHTATLPHAPSFFDGTGRGATSRART